MKGKLSFRDLALVDYYFNHPEVSKTEIAKRFRITKSYVSMIISNYYKSGVKLKSDSEEWADADELNGEYNPAHDFRNLIKYE
jgi:DNA-directed RNA polymerase specialized sigma subunit